MRKHFPDILHIRISYDFLEKGGVSIIMTKRTICFYSTYITLIVINNIHINALPLEPVFHPDVIFNALKQAPTITTADRGGNWIIG